MPAQGFCFLSLLVTAHLNLFQANLSKEYKVASERCSIVQQCECFTFAAVEGRAGKSTTINLPENLE